jgi:hypothetical protein
MAPGLPARVALVCAVLAIAGAAHADERRPVAIIELTGASRTDPAYRLADDLYNDLVNHFDLKPLGSDNQSALLGEFEDEDKPRIDAAKRAKQEVEDALAQLDYRTAANAANRGMDNLANVVPVSEVLGLYADLAFGYGQAMLGLRKPNDANQIFGLVHRLDPARAPDPTRYEPAIVTAFRAAAGKRIEVASIEIKGDGRVWIDGIEQGPANAKYETSVGVHFMQLIGPERETRGEQVEVKTTNPPHEIQPAPATTELMIRRLRLALKRALDPAGRTAAIQQLAKLLKISDAVLIAKTGDKLVVQTWREKTGFSAYVTHKDETPIELLEPLAPPRIRVRPRPLPPMPPLVDNTPWYDKNWVRASAVGGVVVSVLGALLYATRDRTLPNPNTDIQVDH